MSGAEFIPDEAVEAAYLAFDGQPSEGRDVDLPKFARILAAAMPHLNIPDEAAIRADVLRQAIARIWAVPNSSHSCAELQRMADEAVGS